MEKFIIVKSIAVPWLIPNVDTDTITPMKRMINIDEIEKYAFEPYRFINGDGDKGELNMEFPLNMPVYSNAKIMIVGENFGCGSSRETAPEAIAKMGIRCLIGSSFAGIFRKNCFQQGILTISLPIIKIMELAKEAESLKDFIVNLPEKTLYTPSGEKINFQIEDMRRKSLMEGLDDVGLTLKSVDLIDDFFQADRKKRKWLY